MVIDFRNEQFSLDMGTTRDKTNITQEQDSSSHRFLCFYLNNQEYGVDLNQVKQIVQPTDVTWVPRAAPHVLGIIYIRGDVVTLADTRQLMGITPSPQPATAKILLTTLDEETIGLLVDSISQVRRVEADAFEINPTLGDGAASEHVLGIARPNAETHITIIDLLGILAEKMK